MVRVEYFNEFLNRGKVPSLLMLNLPIKDAITTVGPFQGAGFLDSVTAQSSINGPASPASVDPFMNTIDRF
jgi:hypothetical protein